MGTPALPVFVPGLLSARMPVRLRGMTARSGFRPAIPPTADSGLSQHSCRKLSPVPPATTARVAAPLPPTGRMRQDKKLRHIPRDAERLAHRFNGIVPCHALVTQPVNELLAAQPPAWFRPVSDQVPVHDSTPHGRSSGLFRDLNSSACSSLQAACRSYIPYQHYYRESLRYQGCRIRRA